MRPIKILAIPPEPWYMNIYADYVARYLSDEFIIDVGPVPYQPYDTYLDRYPAEPLGMKNPNEYDLLWPIWPGHWSVYPKEIYRHKMIVIHGLPMECEYQNVAGVAAASPFAETALNRSQIKHHSLRYGIDAELFRPFPMIRDDDYLHVGMIGTLHNPKRITKILFPIIRDIPGVRIMFSTTHRVSNLQDLEYIGGHEAKKCVFECAKPWVTLPNTYNRFDIVIRSDHDPGYSFPVEEAQACGVPVIATNGGIDHLFTQAGGGILIEAPTVDADGTGREYYMNNQEELAKRIREAIIWMRDHPQERKKMGKKGREEILKNWTWEKQIPKWREFFREAYENSNRLSKRQ